MINGVENKPRGRETIEWIELTTPLVIENLRESARRFRDNPHGGTSAPSIEAQTKKIEAIEDMLSDHDEFTNRHDKKKSPLFRIIRGYLCEFAWQTERQIMPCNTENGRNPEAAAYYETHPDEFNRVCKNGVEHTAAGFNRLRNKYPRNAYGNDPVFHALGGIIRATIDTFKKEYPKFDSSSPVVASLYNDHLHVVKRSIESADRRIPWPAEALVALEQESDASKKAALRNCLDDLSALVLRGRLGEAGIASFKESLTEAGIRDASVHDAIISHYEAFQQLIARSAIAGRSSQFAASDNKTTLHI